VSWEVLGNASVIVTLAAGVITLVTVVSYLLTRPKIELRLTEQGVVGVHNHGRNQSIKNLRMGWAFLGEDGIAYEGSGADPWGADLVPKTGRWMFLRSADGGDDLPVRTHDGYVNEFAVPRGHGIIIEFYWQHAFIPWMISRTVVLSESREDLGEKRAVKLSRREGKKQWNLRVPSPSRELN
jgi:hypothetical protein